MMQWLDMVQYVISPEVYRKIVEHMFADNIFSHGRIVVLSNFTHDVCKRYPQHAGEILQIQNSLLLCYIQRVFNSETMKNHHIQQQEFTSIGTSINYYTCYNGWRHVLE